MAWTKKHKQDEVEAGAVGHDQAADGIGAENDKAWTKPKIGEEQRKPSRIKLVPFEEICLGTERP